MMKQGNRRLGRLITMTQPLSALEERVVRRWYLNTRVETIFRMRMRSGGGCFCIIQGGHVTKNRNAGQQGGDAMHSTGPEAA